MISADINWLSISTGTLMIIFAIVCVLMSTIILMQRPKNEGLGAAFGSGTTDQLFGARTTNVLQKSTVYLATIFFVLVLTLSILINKRPKPTTLVSDAKPSAEAPAAPVTPAVPAPTELPVVPETTKALEPEPVAPPVDTTTTPPVVTPAPETETPAPAPEPTTPPADPAEKPAKEEAPK